MIMLTTCSSYDLIETGVMATSRVQDFHTRVQGPVLILVISHHPLAEAVRADQGSQPPSCS